MCFVFLSSSFTRGVILDTRHCELFCEHRHTSMRPYYARARTTGVTYYPLGNDDLPQRPILYLTSYSWYSNTFWYLYLFSDSVCSCYVGNLLFLRLWELVLRLPQYVLIIETPDILLKSHPRWFSKRAPEHGSGFPRGTRFFFDPSNQFLRRFCFVRTSRTLTHKPVFCQRLKNVLTCGFSCRNVKCAYSIRVLR